MSPKINNPIIKNIIAKIVKTKFPILPCNLILTPSYANTRKIMYTML